MEKRRTEKGTKEKGIMNVRVVIIRHLEIGVKKYAACEHSEVMYV